MPRKFDPNKRRAPVPPEAFDTGLLGGEASPTHRLPGDLLLLRVGDVWLHGDPGRTYAVLSVEHDAAGGDSLVTVDVDREATTIRVDSDTMLKGLTTTQIAKSVRAWKAAATITTKPE